MKESYGEGLATHTDPESCVVAREGDGEALTGECAGWVLSREIRQVRDADSVRSKGKATISVSLWRGVLVSREVRDPRHAWKQPAREPGDPAFIPAAWLGTHREL